MSTTVVQDQPVPDLSGNPSAAELEQLIDRYTANLMRASFSLGFPESEAEELVQATFCAFLEGGKRFQKRSQILTYLFGILYNKAKETRRLQARHESMDAAIDQSYDAHFDAEEHWDQPSMDRMTEVEKKVQSDRIGELLQQCLEGLNAAMRMAFTLREVERLEPDAICTTLGLTLSNLGVTLFRARHKLRDCLTAKGAVIV